MEAIIPGSTHARWADPFPQNVVRKRANAAGHPPLSKSHTLSLSETKEFDDTDHPTLASDQSKAGRSKTLPPSARVLDIEEISSKKNQLLRSLSVNPHHHQDQKLV